MNDVTFHSAESTRLKAGEDCFAWANRTYFPSFPGVHVCGSDHEENRFFTVLDWPTKSAEEARRLFEAARAECETSKDEADFVVDLNDRESCDTDFWSNRQMLPRLYAILQREAA